MYKAEVIKMKEVVEVIVKARYVIVDVNNNLVFQNEPSSFGEPIAMYRAGVWIGVEKV